MLFFIVSMILFAVAIFGFLAALGLWTYADAKARTDKPELWTLIVLLVPNLVGLIIYLLVGRDKEPKSPGRFKKALIASVILLAVSCILMIGGVINVFLSDAEFQTYSGLKIGSTESYWNNEWKVSFKSAGTEYSKNPNLSGGDLEAFYVTGNCESGKLYLRISQGETEKILDISDFFNETVDMSEFSPGKIKLVIYNSEAKNASITVSWRR